MRNKAPIALFAYRRPDHLENVIKALLDNRLASESDLTIFIDGPKGDAERSAVDSVRSIARQAQGFKSIRIVEQPKNLGLANSIIAGVSEILSTADRVIVIEDDVVCSPQTLEWFDQTLEYYHAIQGVFSITAYRPPIEIVPNPIGWCYGGIFLPRSGSWGWATWADRWRRCDWSIDHALAELGDSHVRQRYLQTGADKIEMLQAQKNGIIDTWDILFDWSQFRNGAVTLYPIISLTRNIGFDGSGTNCIDTFAFEPNVGELDFTLPLAPKVVVDDDSLAGLRRFYERNSGGLIRRLFRPVYRAMTALVSNVVPKRR